MKRSTLTACALVVASCGQETPPHSVAEFMDDPILLEATVVRCGQDRTASRYDVECINVRDAVDRLAAAREQARRDELEAESERKRQALRRAQQAAAEARKRAEEAARRREEAAYFGEFEPVVPDDEEPRPDAAGQPDPEENADSAFVPESSVPAAAEPGVEGTSEPQPDIEALPVQPASAGSDVRVEGGELESVREELKRRQGDAQQ